MTTRAIEAALMPSSSTTPIARMSRWDTVENIGIWGSVFEFYWFDPSADDAGLARH